MQKHIDKLVNKIKMEIPKHKLHYNFDKDSNFKGRLSIVGYTSQENQETMQGGTMLYNRGPKFKDPLPIGPKAL